MADEPRRLPAPIWHAKKDALDGDIEYFDGYPDRWFRERPCVPGELWPIEVDSGMLVVICVGGGEDGTRTIYHQVRDPNIPLVRQAAGLLRLVMDKAGQG